MEYQATPTVLDDQSNREGALAAKIPSAARGRDWQLSIRSRHVFGSGTSAPMKLRAGNGQCFSSMLGLQVPIAVPAVTITAGGGFTGKFQVAIQKSNIARPCLSDISPVFPPPAIEVKNWPTATTQRGINGSGGNDNARIAQKFRVPTTVGGLSLEGGTQVYRSVDLKIRRVAGSTAGKVFVGIYRDNAGDVPPDVSVASFPVNVADLELSSVPWADIVRTRFLFRTEAILPTGSYFWIAIYTQGATAEIQWAQASGDTYADGSVKRYPNPSGPWADDTAGIDCDFRMEPGGDPRSHDNFISVENSFVTVTNLAEFADDATYEDFDSLALMIRTPELGTWREAAVAAYDDEKVSFNNSILTLPGRRSTLPNFNRPFGGLKHAIAFNVAGVNRIIGTGRKGFDNYLDLEVLLTVGVSILQRANFDDDGNFDPTTDVYALGKVDTDEVTWVHGISGLDPDTETVFGFPIEDIDGYLATIYECPNDPILTAAASNPTPRYIPLRGEVAARAIVRLVVIDDVTRVTLTNIQGTIPIHDGTVQTSGIRIEFRRRVLAKATRGSSVVTLTYADDDSGSEGAWAGDGSGAYFADLWMVGHVIAFGGDGIGTILRVSPRTVPYNRPWPCAIRHPSGEIILERPWEGETCIHDFLLVPESKSIFVGGGQADNWQSTSAKLTLNKLPLNYPIVGLAVMKDQLCAVTAFREILVIDFPSGVTEPESLIDAVGYDIRQEASMLTRSLEFSAARTGPVFSDQMGNGFISGAAGKYRIDLQEATNITKEVFSDRIDTYDKATFIDDAAAVDLGHAKRAVIRFGGYALQNDFKRLTETTNIFNDVLNETYTRLDVTWHTARPRRNIQLLFDHKAGAFSSLVNFAEVDSMTTILMKDGSTRVLAGANGRLTLFSDPARPGSNMPQDAYTNLRIQKQSLWFRDFPGTQIRALSSGDLAGNIVVFTETDPLPDTAGYWYLTNSGMMLYKVDDETGAYEKAEVLFPTGAIGGVSGELVTLLLNPVGPWTRSATKTYTLIFGAREFLIELPTIVPGTGFRTVSLERYRIVMEDYQPTGSPPYNFPLLLDIETAEGQPTTIALDTKALGRTKTRELRWEKTRRSKRTSKLRITMRGIAPPNSHLSLKAFQIVYREE